MWNVRSVFFALVIALLPLLCQEFCGLICVISLIAYFIHYVDDIYHNVNDLYSKNNNYNNGNIDISTSVTTTVWINDYDYGDDNNDE